MSTSRNSTIGIKSKLRNANKKIKINLNNILIALPRDLIRYQIFPFLSLNDLSRLDVAMTNHRTRIVLLDSFQGLRLEQKVLISSNSTAKFCISRNFRLSDIVIMSEKPRDICRTLFKANTSVLQLTLGKASFRTDILYLIAKHLYQIKVIKKVSDELFFSIKDEAIHALSLHCSKLTELDLSRSNITDSAILALSKGCRGLMRLNISWCGRLSDASVIAISLSCQDLIDLNIAEIYDLTDESIYKLSDNNRKLESLDISGCIFSEEAMICLFKKCNRLTDVNISFIDGIGDSAISELSLRCPELFRLICIHNEQLSNISLINLSKNCANLTHLNLHQSCDNFTHDGVIALSQGCSRLTYLDITGYSCLNRDLLFEELCNKFGRLSTFLHDTIESTDDFDDGSSEGYMCSVCGDFHSYN